MKVKFKKGGKSKGPELVILSDKGEDLRYAEAERVRAGCDDSLFPFEVKQSRGRYTFSYYLGACQPVSVVLKQGVPSECLYGMLRSFARLAKVCQGNELSIQRVCFDERCLFYDPVRFSMAFVYVPLSSNDLMGHSIFDALDYLLSNANPDTPRAQQIRDLMLDYVRRNAIFSAIDYEEMLRQWKVIQADSPSGSIAQRSGDTYRFDRSDEYGYSFVREQPFRQSYEASLDIVSFDSDEVRFVAMDGSNDWILGGGPHRIGRSGECDIVLKDIEGLSRRHACITVGAGGDCTIEDLGSMNGTRVNGRLLRAHERYSVSPGDVIEMAYRSFKLEAKE